LHDGELTEVDTEMLVAMALALQGAPLNPVPAEEARAAVSAWVECVTAPLGDGPTAAAPPSGQTAEQVVDAAIQSCKEQEDTLRDLYIARGGMEEGNRQMDAYIGRTRQHIVEALRQAASH
jgi:hypothetical protein